jgi:hypothetical protein
LIKRLNGYRLLNFNNTTIAMNSNVFQDSAGPQIDRMPTIYTKNDKLSRFNPA